MQWVHWSRTGQFRQVCAANLITMASVPRWVPGSTRCWPVPAGSSPAGCRSRWSSWPGYTRRLALGLPGVIGQQRGEQRDFPAAQTVEDQCRRRVAPNRGSARRAAERAGPARRGSDQSSLPPPRGHVRSRHPDDDVRSFPGRGDAERSAAPGRPYEGGRRCASDSWEPTTGADTSSH